MTSRDFAYWLQGFLEIENPEEITEKQLNMIKNHLKLVFKDDIDKSFGDLKYRKKLSKIHEGEIETINC